MYEERDFAKFEFAIEEHSRFISSLEKLIKEEFDRESKKGTEIYSILKKLEIDIMWCKENIKVHDKSHREFTTPEGIKLGQLLTKITIYSSLATTIALGVISLASRIIFK
ncbi:MAG: hypothetical protein ACOYWZ_08770 [Bacillota bacterium]